jgi:phenylacetate-CoA ligase
MEALKIMPVDFLRKLRGNLAVLRQLPGQRNVPWLPDEKWRTLRDRRVRAMVRHATATVPHYRDLFRELGLDPRDIRTADDLRGLPLLAKETVRRDPARFLSEACHDGNALPLITSGSTREPLEVWHDHGSLLANIAYGERERDVLADLSGKGLRWREIVLEYEGSTLEKVLAFYRRSTFIPVRPDRRHVRITLPVETVVEEVNRFRPDVIFGFAGYLEMLFRTVAARGLDMHRPRVVVFAGEAMTGPGRQMIREDFGIKVVAFYNCVEVFKIGFACASGDDYHLHADLCHVRIVGPDGLDLPEGTPGEVVISNLVNRATVLLNYRLGDMAAKTTGPCACGRTLPLLTGLDGRTEDVLLPPAGGFVHPFSVWKVFKTRPEVLRYQLIQQAPSRFDLRLVTADRETYDRLLLGVLDDLRELLGPGAVLQPSFHERLEPGPRGKFRAVIRTCHGSTGGR